MYLRKYRAYDLTAERWRQEWEWQYSIRLNLSKKLVVLNIFLSGSNTKRCYPETLQIPSKEMDVKDREDPTYATSGQRFTFAISPFSTRLPHEIESFKSWWQTFIQTTLVAHEKVVLKWGIIGKWAQPGSIFKRVNRARGEFESPTWFTTLILLFLETSPMK